MDSTFLIYFKWIVYGAMFAAVGIVVLICLYYFLRWQAFQPFSPRDRSRYTTFGEKKDEEDEKEANRRRRKIRYWFWGGK